MKTNDDRSCSIHCHFNLSGFDVSWIREPFPFQYDNFSRGHGSLTPSHANEAMEFRPEENVDAHSCTCFVETFDKLLYYGGSHAFPFHFRSGFDACPIHFRSGFDACPFHFRSGFDAGPFHFRPGFDAYPIHFRSGFDACPFHFQSRFTRPLLLRNYHLDYVGHC